MSIKKKHELTRDLVDEVIETVLGYSSLDDCKDKFFTKRRLEETDALRKFKENRLQERLRECMATYDCRKIFIDEENYTNDDIFTIIRAVLRKYNYKITAFSNSMGDVKQRVYTIIKNGG